ncbi:hypothetical protein CWI38_2247p0010 [Hamiltosporidium tvaerminnensis]|uniref:RRM domain-containing protein n=1 Tax=Hamiltosporidium tvaerminnensis TaxID=1176355 RepID=A0A4Q9L6B4_9MICR|nr:transformer 2 beta [Hamiltosporidium tvaerminnensis]TBU03157.1 hypothetical protein CWI37_0346p0020 [Hamiltosporidium tvaerminnensis]TBU08549.1 hypothetical protein CWI38_2247p0010 [Hamiltosporidium tvaerminnensis]
MSGETETSQTVEKNTEWDTKKDNEKKSDTSKENSTYEGRESRWDTDSRSKRDGDNDYSQFDNQNERSMGRSEGEVKRNIDDADVPVIKGWGNDDGDFSSNKKKYESDRNDNYGRSDRRPPRRFDDQRNNSYDTGRGRRGDSYDGERAYGGRNKERWEEGRPSRRSEGGERERRQDDGKWSSEGRERKTGGWDGERNNRSEYPRKRRLNDEYAEDRERGFDERKPPRRYDEDRSFGDFRPEDDRYERNTDFRRGRPGEEGSYGREGGRDDFRRGGSSYKREGYGTEGRRGYRGRSEGRDREAFYEDSIDRRDSRRGRSGDEFGNKRTKRPVPVNPPPSKVIGLFGLGVQATIEDVKDFLMENIPDVAYDNVHLVKDRETGDSRGFAFVYFSSIDASISAKEGLLGKSILGREVRVDYSISDAPRPSRFNEENI